MTSLALDLFFSAFLANLYLCLKFTFGLYGLLFLKLLSLFPIIDEANSFLTWNQIKLKFLKKFRKKKKIQFKNSNFLNP